MVSESIKILLYIFAFAAIAFGIYNLYKDNEKKVSYISFVFSVVLFLISLIPADINSFLQFLHIPELTITLTSTSTPLSKLTPTTTPTPVQTPNTLEIDSITYRRYGKVSIQSKIKDNSYFDFESAKIYSSRNENILFSNISDFLLSGEFNNYLVIQNSSNVKIEGSHNDFLVISNCQNVTFDTDAKFNDVYLFKCNVNGTLDKSNTIHLLEDFENTNFLSKMTDNTNYKKVRIEDDNEKPVVVITTARYNNLKPGETITFTVKITDNNNNEFEKINLARNDVTIKGVKGIISIRTVDDTTYEIVCSQIERTPKEVTVSVPAGVLIDLSKNISEAASNTYTFSSN